MGNRYHQWVRSTCRYQAPSNDRLCSVYYYFYERTRGVILSSRSGSKGLSTLESMITGWVAGMNASTISLWGRFDLVQVLLPQSSATPSGLSRHLRRFKVWQNRLNRPRPPPLLDQLRNCLSSRLFSTYLLPMVLSVSCVVLVQRWCLLSTR